MDVEITPERPREGSIVEEVARGTRVDGVDAVVAIRRGEVGDPGRRERRQRGGITGRPTTQRSTLGLDTGFDRTIELSETGRRGPIRRDTRREAGVDREVEGCSSRVDFGLGFIELGRDPLVYGVLTDDRKHGVYIAVHVHHRADRTAG